MANLAAALRNEIARLARKEVKAHTGTTKRASAQYRRDIAALKRELGSVKQELAFLRSQEKKRVIAKPAPDLANGARFSPAGVKKHRDRLGLSAADYAALVGVSGLTVYNWEKGKSRPRKEQLAALVEVRKLGKRAAWKKLEMME